MLFLLLVLFIIHGCKKDVNISERKKLATLCKIWGAVKYYDPKINKSTLDWDSVLIASIEKTRKTNSRVELDSIFDVLLLSKKGSQKSLLSENLDWVNSDSLISKGNRESLLAVLNNGVDSNKYVFFHPTIGIPIFQERESKDIDKVETRLLSLFRFWNTINYYYPYKNLLKEDWNKTLEDFIPKFIEANDKEKYHFALLELVAKIKDSHASLDKVPQKRPPFGLKLIDGKLVITTINDSAVCSRGKFKPGMEIVKINNIKVSDAVKQNAKYISLGNETGFNASIGYFLLNQKMEKSPYLVKQSSEDDLFSYSFITVLKDLKEVDETIMLMEPQFYKKEFPKVYKPTKIDPNTLYFNFAYLNKNNLTSNFKDINNYESLIFDLRCYPDWIVNEVMNEISCSENPVAKVYSIDQKNPGSIKKDSVMIFKGQNKKNCFEGMIYVLVDHRTFSRAEFFVMCLQSMKNVTVIGEQTAGADGDVTQIGLPGGYVCAFSGLGICYPDNSVSQQSGVKIDIPVKYEISDYVNGVDPALKKAIDFCQSKKNNHYAFAPEPVFSKPLAGLLESILKKDQKFREELETYEEKYGYDSKEVKILWDSINKIDQENLEQIEEIVDKYGWPDSSVIGVNGSVAIFLVIQHSDQRIQEKYLPLMREAVKKGNAYPHDLALLEDRVALWQGKKQIYGSQVIRDTLTGKFIVRPIEDEENVNKRRAEVGLEPIELYLRNWDIEYKTTKKNENNWDYRDWSILTFFLLIGLFIALNTVYDRKP